MNCWYVMTVPRDNWLAKLLEGWRLPFVVEPMRGPHGVYSILLERDDEPIAAR